MAQSYFFKSLSTFRKKIFAQFISFFVQFLFDKFIWICMFNGEWHMLLFFVVYFGFRSDFPILNSITYFHSHSIHVYTHEICLYLIFELYILSLTDYKSNNIHSIQAYTHTYTHTYIHIVWSLVIIHWNAIVQRNAQHFRRL